ncbi:glycolate oxidase subunit GlcE [Ideonella azotifigens]|uniref:Glycolate oxidase subunit GlcE n=1 Tax=Ideonella azotifigens TaxID=513160 RepID=A0ABN1KB10_9BURK
MSESSSTEMNQATGPASDAVPRDLPAAVEASTEIALGASIAAEAGAPSVPAIEPALRRILDVVREAAAHERALCLRGSGSKDFLGGPLLGEPLDLRPLRGITSYEPTELVVTARAGTPLDELEAALAEHGQCLPFEPPRLGRDGAGQPLGGTVGGMVASGLAGPARAAAGSVRDHVLGACLLNGRGELLRFGGTVMKNVAGYDVSRLLAGSMGVLGVICEVSLKVLPRPPATRTLRFDMDQANALRHLNEWAGQPLPLQASAWWDGILVLRLAGAEAAVASAARLLGGEAIPPPLAAGFWAGLRDQRDEFFLHAEAVLAAGDGESTGFSLWQLSVAPTAPRLELAGETLLEWGGGRRWLLSREPAGRVREAGLAARGHATLYRRGAGTAAPDDGAIFAPLSAPLLRLHQQLKAAFDPQRIFNRERLHPQL